VKGRAEFAAASMAIKERYYAQAITLLEGFLKQNPDRPEAVFNLALAHDGAQHHAAAIQGYRKYLQLRPEASNRDWVTQRIPRLEQDRKDWLDYRVQLLNSDLAYLKNYYQALFNRSRNALASEFNGFITERMDLYSTLPEQLEMDEPWLRSSSRRLRDSFANVAKRLNSPTFDRDAVSLLTIPVAELEGIVRRLQPTIGRP
jgi:tetratricopeptide (TPR) repeat protein